MANDVQAHLREVGRLAVIDLRGEVTALAEETITRAYRAASAQGARTILLTFAGVEYLNSAGLSIIIGILTEVRRADQRLVVAGLTPHYHKIFQIMGLTQYAPVFETEDAARRAIETDKESDIH